MCGIAGWVDRDAHLLRERATVQNMAGELACRGPDAEGLWISPKAALAHRRLAVMDPAGGMQPMSAGPALLAFSGEIYNFAALRRELESYGHHFESSSDTEVLLRAYLQWRLDCLPRLAGMFAFAIWDNKQQELLLARDRLGIKPLLYALLPTGLIFASEAKALLRHPAAEAAVDEEGLAELFAMSPGRTPGSAIYKGMRELEPGSYLIHDLAGARTGRYWRLQSHAHTDSLPATIETVRGLLDEIVPEQLVSDVPVCALLSGGVDSSALTAIAARAPGRPGPLGTYSVGFTDSEFALTRLHSSWDTPYAVRAARHLGCDHRELRVNGQDLIDQLGATVTARDLPGMGDIDASLYLLFREIRQRYTVALSGEAADEVFRGYRWFTPGGQGGPTFPWIYPAPGDLDIRAPDLRVAPYERARYHEALAEVPAVPGESARDRRSRELAYLTLTRFLPALLERKDRLSMAVGLEVRVPYCDHRLVDYTWNIPHDLHWADGIEKALLRRAVHDLLPREILRRPKSHYPSTQSPAYWRVVAERVEDWLATPSSPSWPYFDRAKIKQLLTSGRPYLPTRPSLTWLLEFDTWMRTYGVAS
ncbi:asparagine synthase (glutamine-hydrolyzing) [Nonomuraea typhae]|uniref:asparagine synthase (glutamine-hydrolyzing) n=1 Tax=Nonomuraea typhae TaxID=2603600 RepID=A0ABW7YSS4_9ACTN